MKRSAIVILTLCIFLTFNSVPAFSQGTVSLQEGVKQYKDENYDQSIDILSKVRAQDPSSSIAAFYLGMGYKQIGAFPKASVHLEDAVTLKPHIREAVVELIDVLYRLGSDDEALRWIAVAEEENISPSRVAFLKGMVLSHKNKNPEAIETFEIAKEMDKSLIQPADFQIALCYVKEKDYSEAKKRFGTLILEDPRSDLAAYARDYQDALEKKAYAEQPLHLTLSVLPGYDTNIILKPTDSSVAEDITGERGYVLSSSLRVDYMPKLSGPWTFSSQVALSSNVNSKHTHDHDIFAGTFAAAPGYAAGRFAVNLLASLPGTLLRTDPALPHPPSSSPGYKRYLEYTTYGPAFRYLVTASNMVELFVGYDRNEFYNQKVTSPQTNREGEGIRTYLSWMWFFMEDGFLNLRYEYNRQATDGSWYQYRGNHFTINAGIPLLPKQKAKELGPLNLQLAGGVFLQDYDYVQSTGTMRDDETYTASVGMSWAFINNISAIVQYIYTKCHSTIDVNSYDRNQYFAGLELRF
ncbi:MAG: tetratricopeptide repeat protein [Smithellaceae bacterium]|nr:tetratricopeptide repeat protein [Smithellaceae bacterium]